MSDEVVGFNRQDADALLREIGNTGGEVRQFSHPTGVSSIAIAKTGGSAISAASGTTAGSGTVTLQYLSGSTITATTDTVTAYNLASSTVAANTYIQIKREYISGRWLIDFEDCG